MWAAIVAFLPFLQQILNWWNGVEADRKAAGDAENSAEKQHQNDGAQSVSDKDSADQQNSDLDQLQKELENPTAKPTTTK